MTPSAKNRCVILEVHCSPAETLTNGLDGGQVVDKVAFAQVEGHLSVRGALLKHFEIHDHFGDGFWEFLFL